MFYFINKVGVGQGYEAKKKQQKKNRKFKQLEAVYKLSFMICIALVK